MARSQSTARIRQASADRKPRRRRASNDAVLVNQIQAIVSELPSYGYCQVWGTPAPTVN
ncbi:hypothetical protein [Azotobacter armeniacus]